MSTCYRCKKQAEAPELHVLPDGWDQLDGDEFCADCAKLIEQGYKLAAMTTVLRDFVVMAENEIRRVKFGYASGPSMRDVVGQWEAAVREARVLLPKEMRDE